VDDVLARIVWKLARKHSWGTPVSRDDLVRSVAGDIDHDVVERVLDTEVGSLTFVHDGHDGYAIPNSRLAHLQAAEWLRRNTSLGDIEIGATLSRLPPQWPE
jgi:hypothetical protein